MTLTVLIRRTGRALAGMLWFRIDGGWIYYVVLAAFGAVVTSAIYLISRGGWFVALGLWTLIDGMTVTLFLLHLWLTRRSRAGSSPR